MAASFLSMPDRMTRKSLLHDEIIYASIFYITNYSIVKEK